MKNKIQEDQIVYKTIPLFERMTTTVLGIPFNAGWKVSEEKLDWERDTSAFNKAIVLVSKNNKGMSKKIPWQLMSRCMAESYRNCAEAISYYRGSAMAEVIDMEATFGKYLKV
jgi:hypothetical protein